MKPPENGDEIAPMARLSRFSLAADPLHEGSLDLPARLHAALFLAAHFMHKLMCLISVTGSVISDLVPPPLAAMGTF
jgi:hypothetical protein